jgi:Integrase core domain
MARSRLLTALPLATALLADGALAQMPCLIVFIFRPEIKDVPRLSAERRESPWQNGYAERLIGTVRGECLDRMLIFGEAHLRRILSMYAIYYNESRTHLSLHKDALLYRAIQRSGTVVAVPVLGGLHHRYARI